MGTALTDEQVGELGRMAQTVLLALDADKAGQEAMLKASRLAARRKLELKVVELPAGADPADLVQREGAEAIETAIGKAAPFVRFSVERVLAAGDDTSPEGRDRMIGELRPVFATLAAERDAHGLDAAGLGPLRVARAAGRDAARRGRRGCCFQHAEHSSGYGHGRNASAQGGDGQSAQRVARPAEMTRREDTERAFLALCIASPAEGEGALASLELDEHFSSGLLRRAAKHLREGNLHEPMADAPGDNASLDEDAPLKRLLAELVVEAGRDASDTAMLEVQRLQLELARVERQIQRARGEEAGDVSDLAHRRAEVKLAFDRAYGRVLERTGGG